MSETQSDDDSTGSSGDPVCGDGVADGEEQCDGKDLRSVDCQTLDLGGGELSCAADSNFDPSACELFEECGDDVASGSENCDRTDLAGGDCDARGYDGGRLGCTRDCTYDFTFCGGFVGCGNNIIDPGEHDE